MLRSRTSDRARGFGGGLGLRELAKQHIPLQKLAAQLKLSHGLLGEAADGFTLRRADLVRLEPDGTKGRVLLHIPKEETKSKLQDIVAELPEEVARRLRWYRRNILPRLGADPNGRLFVYREW